MLAHGPLTVAQATLDAVETAIVVVDATMRARTVNHAAEFLLSLESGLQVVRLGSGQRAEFRLSIRHRWTSDIILGFVREVALGTGAGGSLRIPREAKRKPLAVLIMPLPVHLAPTAHAAGQGTVKGSAMPLFRDLEQPSAPEVCQVACVFGLTRAEAEVAVELCAGSTAEIVATRRGTSVTTLRAQVRVVLEKAAFRNLRDLAQAVARLG